MVFAACDEAKPYFPPQRETMITELESAGSLQGLSLSKKGFMKDEVT